MLTFIYMYLYIRVTTPTHNVAIARLDLKTLWYSHWLDEPFADRYYRYLYIKVNMTRQIYQQIGRLATCFIIIYKYIVHKNIDNLRN